MRQFFSLHNFKNLFMTKRNRKQFCLLWLGLFIIAAQLQTCQPAAPQVPAITHIVIIGVDGMSPDGVNKAITPVMDSLMNNGSYTLQARGVLPTSSSSNWASMIMGAGPEQHGITSNGWQPDDYSLPAVTSGTEEIFPTIFGLIRQQKPAAEIGAIYNWEDFGRLFEKSAVNYNVHGKTEKETAMLASTYIREKKPLFTFVHFDHVDHAGHEAGHGTAAYYQAVALADSLMGQIIQATKQAGIIEETVFIISADHGGVGKGHGGETLAEIQIPFIVCGKGIKKGYQIKHPVYTYDNAATVAFLLGLETPYAWIGKPVKSIVEGFPVPVAIEVEEKLAAPTIYPPAKENAPAGGLFVDTQPQVEIKPAQPKQTIRYTLDGSEPTTTSIQYQSPFPLTESKVVKAKVFMDNKESYTAQAFFRLASANSDHGVKYSYYKGNNWNKLPDFENLKHSASGKLYEFRIDSIPGANGQYAVKFEAFLQINQAGNYTFYTLSDDGSKLLVDNQEVVNNDGDHGALERSGKIRLEKGLHPLTVLYFNGGGGSWLDVYYRGPSLVKQIIPPSVLYLTNQTNSLNTVSQ
jgi:hypothetical protein